VTAASRNPRTAGRALRIGLTGPIGCGKSTVAGWLAELGATVIDADDIARDVSAPGTAGEGAILARFEGAAGPDGHLDRTVLARIAFGDPAALRDLEAIVRPAVRARIRATIEAADAAGAEAIVVEAIGLVDGGLAAECDEVWLVECDQASQRDRLAGRGAEPQDAARRIAAQGDLVARVAPLATRRVDTSGAIRDTRALVEDSYRAALARDE